MTMKCTKGITRIGSGKGAQSVGHLSSLSALAAAAVLHGSELGKTRCDVECINHKLGNAGGRLP